MKKVRAKKHLGQHFLNDDSIALKIVEQLQNFGDYKDVVEIGPGMGVLTKYLLKNDTYKTWVVEIDTESVSYLEENFPELDERIIAENFLKIPLLELMQKDTAATIHNYAIIGNLPYNISSQIFFNVLANRRHSEAFGFRKLSTLLKQNVRNLSVFLQAFYDIEYCFTVFPHSFNPPPRVDSGVIRLTRNATKQLDCDEKLFFNIVKVGFNQRRKKLKNPLKAIHVGVEHPLLDHRAEELSVADFVELTNAFTAAKNADQNNVST
jgi:16S rRNA (adenine1518-N6/adenine1519-N6)-dimethyltransferase